MKNWIGDCDQTRSAILPRKFWPTWRSCNCKISRVPSWDADMISQQYFEIKIDYDEQGLAVIVTHRPTGKRRVGRRSGNESLTTTQTRLIDEIRREFFNPDEFQFSIGRCEVGGGIAAWYRVTHRPTGKNKSADS